MPRFKSDKKFQKRSFCLREDDYERMNIIVEHLGYYGPSEFLKTVIRDTYATIPSSCYEAVKGSST